MQMQLILENAIDFPNELENGLDLSSFLSWKVQTMPVVLAQIYTTYIICCR